MKRTREEEKGIDSDIESPWMALLHDNIKCIILWLDPLSRILFSLTNKTNHNLTYIETEIPLIVMEEALFLYGTLRLIQKYDFKGYQDEGALSGHAAIRGDLEILKWLQEKNFKINSYTLECAARYGHLHIMWWLRDIGKLFWTEQTLQQACMYGSVIICQWIVDNGCPEPRIQYDCAIDYGHLDVVKWLVSRGHDMYGIVDDYIQKANDKGHYHIAEWLQFLR